MPDTPSPKAALDTARQGVSEFAGTAQRATAAQLGRAREQARVYGDAAVDQYGVARTHVVERIQDKPVTSVLAVLGVGVVLGVLLGLASQRSYD